jgi:hypothetical protein
MRKLLLIAAAFSATCFAQTSLRQFLGLTDAEAAAIRNANQTYNNVWFSQQDRIDMLNGELAVLLASAAPDPAELGRRAVEFEMIRRDRVLQQTDLQRQIAALLTTPELNAVQKLVSAATLQPLVNDARCAYLLPTQFYWFNTSGFIPIYGDVKLSTFVPSILPYIPPAPTGSFCGSQVFPFSVRQFLALTDTQISSLFAASAAYNNFYAQQQNRLTEIDQATQDLTANPNSDPVVLGLLYLEMANIGKQITAKSAQLRDGALAQLTPAQTIQLKTLRDAQNLLQNNLVNDAAGCNLLTLPAGSSNYPSTVTGTGSFCPLQ